MADLIDGQKITGVTTIQSMYDGNSVWAVLDDGSLVRLTAKAIAQMVNEFQFETIQKRKYLYLTKAIPKGE